MIMEQPNVDNQLEAQVLAVIAEILPAKSKNVEITPKVRLKRELGIDSLGVLRLILRLEQAMKIDLAGIWQNFDFSQIRTVQDVIEFSREMAQRAARQGSSEESAGS